MTSTMHKLNFDTGRTERMIFVPATVVSSSLSSHDEAPSGNARDASGGQEVAEGSHSLPDASLLPGERLFVMFCELFRRGALSNPASAESRCRRLREAGEEKLLVGPLIISSEQAEIAIREACKALLEAGHAAPWFVKASSSLSDSRKLQPPPPPSELANPDRPEVPLEVAPPAPPPVAPQSVLRRRCAPAKAKTGPRPKRSQGQHMARTRVSFAETYVQDVFEVACYRDLKEELWTKDPVDKVSCDKCGLQVDVQNGKLHGGRGFFSRDTYSCSPCLYKHGIAESQLAPIIIEDVGTGHPCYFQCCQCKQDVAREEAKFWDDRSGARRPYCQGCWARGHKSQRRLLEGTGKR